MKTNVFGAPPEAGTPAADMPPRSRLRGVLIFEQNGALALTPCAFRFHAMPPRSRLRGVLIFEQNGALALTPCAFRFHAGF